MILRRIELVNFGRFGEASFSFGPGVNVLTGPNEAGKTTLLEAIPAVLFGLRPPQRLLTWGSPGPCRAALLFEHDNRWLRIERDLLDARVSFGPCDPDGCLLPGSSSSVASDGDPNAYLEQLIELFGFADEELFRASLFFGQGALAIQGGEELASRTRGLITGSVGCDYQQALDGLQKASLAVTRDNPWGLELEGLRELDRVRERIGELEQLWYQTRDRQRRLDQVARELHAVNADLVALRASYEQEIGSGHIQEAPSDGSVTSAAMSANVTELSSVPEVVSADVDAERQELLRELAKTGLPRLLPDDLPFLLDDAEQIRKELVALQGESAALRRQLLDLGHVPWRHAAAATGLILTASGICAWFWPTSSGLALFAGGGASLILWSGLLWRAGRYYAARNRLSTQEHQVEQRREDAQDRLEELDERFRRHRMSPSAVDIVRMRKNLERHRQLSERLALLETGSSSAADSAPYEPLQVQTSPASPTCAQDDVPTPAPVNTSLADLTERIRILDEQRLALAREEALLGADPCDLQRIEEEGEELRERESVLQRRCSALTLAHDTLASVVRESRHGYRERLEAESAQYLGTLTQGRHAALHLGEDFSLTLADRDGCRRPLQAFSGGTRDAVYLSVRLALVRTLAQGRRLPLLLDDPFLTFDRDRLAEALKLLERMSVEQQVILFSHSEILQKRAARERWHQISLAEKRSVATPAAKPVERREDDGQLYLL